MDTVVVTASKGTFTGLADMLQGVPVSVEERPLLGFDEPLDWKPVDAALGRWSTYGSAAFTSPRAARALLARARSLGLSLAGKNSPEVWAGGPATASALELLGPVRIPDQEVTGKLGAARSLAAAMLQAGAKAPVLFPGGDLRRDELTHALRQGGMTVEEVVCYRTVLANESQARAVASLGTIVVVASPSVLRLLAEACAPPRPDLVAVGPTTAASASDAGWRPAAVAAEPSTSALASAITGLLAKR